MLFFATNYILAQTTTPLKDTLGNRLTNVGNKAEYVAESSVYSDKSLAWFIGDIIKYILSMLGVIFLVLLVYGGFLWMTARGDSDVVSKSKDIIINAIIGLIIVLMSYAITYYVVGNMANTTMKGSGGFTEN